MIWVGSALRTKDCVRSAERTLHGKLEIQSSLIITKFVSQQIPIEMLQSLCGFLIMSARRSKARSINP
jgi:hypothetical protein